VDSLGVHLLILRFNSMLVSRSAASVELFLGSSSVVTYLLETRGLPSFFFDGARWFGRRDRVRF